MKIYEAMLRDPRSSSLANEGQARIRNEGDDKALKELRGELETFVCNGQYGNAMESILRNYLIQMGQTRQHAAWVSGFYGSGKSHLLKMLGHLWVNTEFSDGSKARALVPDLPGNIKDHLLELDTQARRTGKPAFAVAGTLPSSRGENVRLSVLSIILHSCGLPVQYPQARFCFWLQDNGWYEKVKKAVESAGKIWLIELNSLYVSGLIARAVMDCDPNFAPNEAEARKTLREQFPDRKEDISTAEFITAMRKALAPDGVLPLTVMILDEAQQYIGDSNDRSTVFTEIAEAIQTETDSRVMLVASGQSALIDTPQLEKLRGRFRITFQLSDTDVEAVTRQVLLRKKPSKFEDIRHVLTANAGEVSKHLQGTRLAEKPEDQKTVLDDYPLLPTRRRFWEECFRAVDAAGTSSQLRSQLRIMDDALKGIAEKEIGVLIPTDMLFDAISNDLVSTGVLLNETEHKIRQADDGTPEGKLKKRLCGLAFLISKLPRETGVDTGVRATPAILADLLVDDLTRDSGPFRKQVEALLHAMAANGDMMLVRDEYRLQTTEGAEWERALNENIKKLQPRENDIATRRDKHLSQAVKEAIDKVSVIQGVAKEKRKLSFHAQEDSPVLGDDIPVWVRDGWAVSQKVAESDARSRGQNDPVVHVFIPRFSADALRAAIVDEEAARQVLEQKSHPSTPEGMEARAGMESRLRAAEKAREDLVRDIMANAVVYQGGGAEVSGMSLSQKIDMAAQAAAARLFLRFKDADYPSWDKVLGRARAGSDRPFALVGWDKPVQEHPVAAEVLKAVGNGIKGGEVGKKLRGAPYGWPQDAIDATIVTLARVDLLTAWANGMQLSPDQLDQSRIKSAELRPVRYRLEATEKIAVRGLFQKAGVEAKPGEEESSAPSFLARLYDLASAAGGEPPLPPKPDTAMIDDLKHLSGAEQLKAMLETKAELEASIFRWEDLGQRAIKRMREWSILSRMLEHGESLLEIAPLQEEAEAIKNGRSLLEGDDSVPIIRAKAAAILRAAVTRRAETMKEAWDKGLQKLGADENWKALDDDEREQILDELGLNEPRKPRISSDDELLSELDNRSLSAWDYQSAAMPELANRALREAAARLTPDVQYQYITLGPVILETEEDVRTWITQQQERLMDAVRLGPVSVG